MDRRTQLIEIRQHWKPPEELARSIPRLVRLTGAGKALLVLAAVLFAGALCGGIVLEMVRAREADEQHFLRDEGTDTDAVVTRVWRGRGDDKPPWVAYRFTSGAGSHEGELKAPLRIWRTLQAGSTLRVRYLPSNPNLNHPVEWRQQVMPVAIPYVVGAVPSLFACLLIFTIRRQRRLVEEGRPAPALVTKLTKTKDGQTIHYEFSLLSGALTNGKGGPSKHPPALDSTICVLYDPDDPRRAAPYPLSLVEPAFFPRQKGHKEQGAGSRKQE